MVRRCIHKPTCQEYAVKIIDITGGGSFSSEEVQELREATLKEVDILQKVSGHPNISKCILQTPLFLRAQATAACFIVRDSALITQVRVLSKSHLV